MTQTHDAPLTIEAVMAAGVKRISGLVDKHGITSPEVLAACERWGGIIDDLNYPDSTCRWCGQPVAHNHNMNWWYHVDDKGGTRACLTHAGAEATPSVNPHPKPFELKGPVTGRLSKPIYGGSPMLGPGPDAELQKHLNDADRNFYNSFKPNDPRQKRTKND